mmetsp:Transcript_114578/g.210564  ORF Transcript_114578/g.210564 Transcript_114578/m.210564 type:complete len:86 (+) Transcript_114578:100-357(+)
MAPFTAASVLNWPMLGLTTTGMDMPVIAAPHCSQHFAKQSDEAQSLDHLPLLRDMRKRQRQVDRWQSFKLVGGTPTAENAGRGES